jgi:hypothetical protein
MLGLNLVACSRDRTTSSAAQASARSAASAPSAVASGAATVNPILKRVNPDNLPVYRGATGRVRGTVTITGDRAPVVPAGKIPANCGLARDMYGRLFREGMNRALADALVTVTGYTGYVPMKTERVGIELRGCTFGARTLAMTLGQQLEIKSGDLETYMPQLGGTHNLATLAVVPGGDPVRLSPASEGRFALRDLLHEFMLAEVFVLKFASFAVTRLDGSYEIAGVPTGEVTVSAVLPATQQATQQKVRVEPDGTLELNLQIAFDRKAWDEEERARSRLGRDAAP